MTSKDTCHWAGTVGISHTWNLVITPVLAVSHKGRLLYRPLMAAQCAITSMSVVGRDGQLLLQLSLQIPQDNFLTKTGWLLSLLQAAV